MKKLISLFLIAILSFASFVNTGFASNNMEKSVYIAEGENVEMFAWAGKAAQELFKIAQKLRDPRIQATVSSSLQKYADDIADYLDDIGGAIGNGANTVWQGVREAVKRAGAAGNEAREIILEIVNDIWN